MTRNSIRESTEAIRVRVSKKEKGRILDELKRKKGTPFWEEAALIPG